MTWSELKDSMRPAGHGGMAALQAPDRVSVDAVFAAALRAAWRGRSCPLAHLVFAKIATRRSLLAWLSEGARRKTNNSFNVVFPRRFTLFIDQGNG